MNNSNINFVIFFLVLFIICFFMNKHNNESFSNDLIDPLDNYHKKPTKNLINITKPKDRAVKGWRSYYRTNYLKGNVEFPDNFEGTMIRNYLDNLNFINY